MPTGQQIIIQPPRLINTSQRRSCDMKRKHFIQYFGVYAFELYVGIPFATSLFHTEGDVIPESDVFSVVETSAGAARAITDRLLKDGGCEGCNGE